MRPSAGGRPGRAAQEGIGHALEHGIRAQATDVGDSFALKGVEKGRGRESRIGTEPDAGDQGAEPAQDRQHKVEAAIGRVHVALPELSAKEVAAFDAGDERVEAADAVVGVVGRAGLMAVDLMGEGVQVQCQLPADRSGAAR